MQTTPTVKRTKPTEKVQQPRGLSTKTLQRMLKKTDHLEDLAYEDLTHRTGFRVALWLLRAYATAAPDRPLILSAERLKALLSYLERCDKHRDLMASQRSRPQQASDPAFLQASRTSPPLPANKEPDPADYVAPAGTSAD